MASNYKEFFSNTKEKCIDIIKKQNQGLGFNTFTLMTDKYKRENFHSDILKAILDINGSHNENKLFLSLFYDLLISLAKKENPSLIKPLEEIYSDNEIEVIREENKTGIAIECKEKKWAIVIDNKINTAVDQPRQLPKYYEKWTKLKGDKIITLIYLTSTDAKKYPDKLCWKDEDENTIAPYYLHLSGYDNVKPSLYSWLVKCEKESKIANNKAVLQQYSQLIKYQGGNYMNDINKENYFAFVNSAKEADIDLSNLYKVIDLLPSFYAIEIQNKLKEKDAALNMFLCEKNDKKEILVINDIKVKTKYGDASFFLDIRCYDFSNYGIMISFREEKSTVTLSYEDTMDLFKDFFTKNNFQYKKSPDDIYYYYFKPIVIDNKKTNYPTKEELDKIVDFIYDTYKDFLEYTKTIEEKEL